MNAIYSLEHFTQNSLVSLDAYGLRDLKLWDLNTMMMNLPDLPEDHRGISARVPYGSVTNPEPRGPAWCDEPGRRYHRLVHTGMMATVGTAEVGMMTDVCEAEAVKFFSDVCIGVNLRRLSRQ